MWDWWWWWWWWFGWGWYGVRWWQQERPRQFYCCLLLAIIHKPIKLGEQGNEVWRWLFGAWGGAGGWLWVVVVLLRVWCWW